MIPVVNGTLGKGLEELEIGRRDEMIHSDFSERSEDHRVKFKKRDISTLTLLENEKKTTGHEGDSDSNYNWCTRNNPQRIGKGTEKVENDRETGDHPDHSITKIG